MATSKVRLNSKALQQYLDGKHGVEAALDAAARRALAQAESNAPVVTGTYRSSLRVETDHTDRMVKRVIADVPYAMQVEAEHGVLGKAL